MNRAAIFICFANYTYLEKKKIEIIQNVEYYLLKKCDIVVECKSFLK